MADVKKLRSDIQKLKKALQAKGVSKTVKDKLQVQLDKAESELAASKKPAKSAKPKKSTPLNRLQSLVKKKKYSAYSKAGVDLKKDAGQPALPTGKRTSKSGKTYYEYRANRIDVKQPPKRYPKLEDGGKTAKIDEVSSMSFRNQYDDYEMIVISKEAEKDGGNIVKDRYLVSAKDINEAKEITEKLWRKQYADNDLSIVKIMSDSLYKLKYSDIYADGGEIEVGDKVKYKNAKYHATVLKVFNDVEIPYAIIEYETGTEPKKAYLEDLQKVELRIAKEYVNPDYMADGGNTTEKEEIFFMIKPNMAKELTDKAKKENIDLEFIETNEDGKEVYRAELTTAQINDYTKLPLQYDFNYDYASGGYMADGGETHLNISDDERMEIKNLKGLIEESMEAIESHEKLAEKSDDKETKSYHENKIKKHKEVLANRKSRLEQLTKRRMAEGGETEKMALGGATVSTQYEKVEGTDYELKIKVYYDKGGISYATYKQEPRGYYLSVSPVQREKRDGYTVESYMAFSGVKTLLLPVQRQSPKAEKQAQEIAEKMMPEMKSYISDKVKEKAGFMKGGGYMAEGGMIKIEEDAYGKSAYIPYKGETFLLEWNTERPTKDSTVISDRSFRRLDEDSSLYQHLLVTLLKAMHENKVQYAEEGAKLAKGGYMAEGGVMSTTHRLSK